MKKLLRLLLASTVLWIVAGPGLAAAQTTITLNQSTGFKIEREVERKSNEYPLFISRQDCFDASPNRFTDQSGEAALGDYTWIEIVPTIKGTQTGDSIQVWVSGGTDCSDAQNRSSNSQDCSLVYLSNQATTLNPTLRVNPRDVVERAHLLEYQPGPAGEPNTCEADKNQQQIPLTFFIFVMRGTQIIAQVTWTNTTMDLLAPPAPETLDIGAGDEAIFFEWEIESANESNDTAGFTLYCVPAGTTSTDMGGATGSGGDAVGGTASTAGGTTGAGGDSGSGGGEMSAEGGQGGAAGVTCGQDILVAGEIPREEAERYDCGSATGRGTRKGTATGLTNYTVYAVAIASSDSVGNSGVLSEVVCVEPKEVTTFYEGYKSAGGKGGGGFCHFGSRGGESLLWLGLLTLAAGAARRRRLSA